MERRTVPFRRVALTLTFIAIALTACSAETKADGRTGSKITSTSSDAATVTVRRQPVADSRLVVDKVELDAPGYAAAYEDVHGTPGRLVGASRLLDAGRHRNVSVKLTTSVNRSVFVVVHVEDNENEKLDFPMSDPPVEGDTGVVLVRMPLRQ